MTSAAAGSLPTEIYGVRSDAGAAALLGSAAGPAPEGVVPCDALEPRCGYICTREPGHDGAHVAHDWRASALAMWLDPSVNPIAEDTVMTPKLDRNSPASFERPSG